MASAAQDDWLFRVLGVRAGQVESVRGSLSPMALARLRLTMEAARKRYEAAIETLKAAFETLLETEGFAGDPRSQDPATLAAIATLDRRVPPIDELADDLADALDRMVNATDPALRLREQQGALTSVAAYRARIEAEPLLREMESSPAGSFKIQGPILAALDELAAGLRG